MYFRRLRAIPLTGIPAAIGAAIAFAVAELAFGYLTASTSFLGSIIVGNGINYAIVLMSRYEEHRARGERSEASLCAAMAGVWRGTLVASIAASAAYASLMVTSFRGFYQFGVMGAVGSLACWAATFTALPALLVLLDRRPGQLARVHRPPIGFSAARRALLAGGAARSPRFHAAGDRRRCSGMRHFLKDPFEYDFRKLYRQAQDHQRGPAVQSRASTTCSGAGRRRPSSWPTASTRWSRSSRRSAGRITTSPAPT